MGWNVWHTGRERSKLLSNRTSRLPGGLDTDFSLLFAPPHSREDTEIWGCARTRGFWGPRGSSWTRPSLNFCWLFELTLTDSESHRSACPASQRPSTWSAPARLWHSHHDTQFSAAITKGPPVVWLREHSIKWASSRPCCCGPP